MLRLIFILMALSLATAVQADVIYVEDFMEDGEPGFDPLFNHNIFSDNGQDPNWMFWFEHILIFPRTTDEITFNLGPGQSVSHASLEVTSGGAEVRFVGTEGELNFSNVDVPGITMYEATHDEIGSIVAIELRSGQGCFDNITINVVPEPSVAYGLIAVGLLCGAVRIRRSSMA